MSVVARRGEHSGLAARRVIAGAIGGLAAAALAASEGASWSVAALFASDVAALVFVIWVWLTVADADAGTTARIARTEDASRAAAEAILIGAGAASLVAVAFTLREAGHSGSPERGLLTALALASVLLAWTSIHTVFLLRYARLYYSPPVGGIDFGDEAPDYRDFAYLALTIGMTFQVSDTDLRGKRVRRVALHHALLSYVFGPELLRLPSARLGLCWDVRHTSRRRPSPRGGGTHSAGRMARCKRGRRPARPALAGTSATPRASRSK